MPFGCCLNVPASTYCQGPRASAACCRVQLRGEEEPCAVVLSCSDSRVPPEMVFDQGLGDIYVVRRVLSCRQWASHPE